MSKCPVSMNPSERIPSRRGESGPGVWLLALALALIVLVSSVGWAQARAAGMAAEAELTCASGHLCAPSASTRLIETITFKDVEVDGECELGVTLHVRGRDGGDEGALTRSVIRLVPATGKTHRVPFTLDTTDLAGSTLVATLTLTHEGQLIWSRRDERDASQMVRIPAVAGAFKDLDTGGGLDGEGSSRIDARVSYANVEAGGDLCLRATLVECETGEALVGADGRALSKCVPIKADEACGEESVSFLVAGALPPDMRLALTTELCQGKRRLAVHTTEEDRCLSVPEISCALIDEDTGLTTGPAQGVVTLVEEVAYEGLVPDLTYRIMGSLHDAETGSVALVGKGKTLEGDGAACEFTPQTACGTVTLTHRVDAGLLAGRSLTSCLVVTRKDDGHIIATFDGLAQGVTFGFASARSVASGAHTGMGAEPADEDARIYSRISYDNLTPGIEYTVDGTLRQRGVQDGLGGNAVAWAHAAFVPDRPCGTLELAYDFCGSQMAASDVEAEEVIRCGGAEVAACTSERPVCIPKLTATVAEAGSGSREALASDETRVSVTVAYENLPADGPCILRCTLMDPSDKRALLGTHGSKISASKAVSPGDVGTVAFALSADTRELAGKGLAVQVMAEIAGSLVASVSGLFDEEATLCLPRLTTSLTGAAAGTGMAALSEPLVGCVSLEGVLAGHTHELTATLIDAETGEAIRGVDGRAVAAYRSVTPETEDSEVTLELPAVTDGRLCGHTLALEALLTCDGTETAHSVVPSAGEGSLRIPKLTARVAPAVPRDKGLSAWARAPLAVSATYENVEAGRRYVVGATVVAGDDELTVLGTGGVQIVAKGEEGCVEIPVILDGGLPAGKDAKVVVDMSLDGALLARATTDATGQLRV